MNWAGFVLVGGKSSRMGCNKALLNIQNRTLAEQVAEQIRIVTNDVRLIGQADTYSSLGYPVVEDLFEGCGPLGGIHAALSATRAEWNLVVACDMPEVAAEFLKLLIARAEEGPADAVIPAGPDGRPEPLCAAYHRRSLPEITNALEAGTFKVMSGISRLKLDVWRVPDARYFHNLNTPQDWTGYSNA